MNFEETSGRDNPAAYRGELADGKHNYLAMYRKIFKSGKKDKPNSTILTFEIFLIIMDSLNSEQEITLDPLKLAEETGRCEENVRKSLKWLEKKGVFKVESRNVQKVVRL